MFICCDVCDCLLIKVGFCLRLMVLLADALFPWVFLLCVGCCYYLLFD